MAVPVKIVEKNGQETVIRFLDTHHARMAARLLNEQPNVRLEGK